jgi:hypothetical protein
MALTLTQLQDFVTHALGGAPASQLSTARIVNYAGQYLMGMRAWRFAERPPVTLSTTAGNRRIQLPLDLRSILAVSGSATSKIELVTPEYLAWLENVPTQHQGAVGFWCALCFPPSNETNRYPFLLCYPEPSTSQADIGKLYYRAGWIDLIQGTDIAPVPVYAEGLLIALVRQMALGLEQDQLEERLSMVQGSAVWRNACQADGGAQEHQGRMTGGAVSELLGEFDRNPYPTYDSVIVP